ncbi:unnamed protein product [Moneuplotes crassus]|uniref:Uncharacterized protein n=1 Tax=Euplotes crassus TaxID=5936 RepID=A0AAD1XET7_EUPCR|nr:unnamed protein product [Moneuplotes crassus]
MSPNQKLFNKGLLVMNNATHYRQEKDKTPGSWNFTKVSVCEECKTKDEIRNPKRIGIYKKIPIKFLSINQMLIKLLVQSSNKVNLIRINEED